MLMDTKMKMPIFSTLVIRLGPKSEVRFIIDYFYKN